VVVVQGGDGALGNRVRAELSAAGLDVIIAVQGPDNTELAQQYSADAVLRTTGNESLRVWITKAGGGIPVTEELNLHGRESDSLALYAIERIRARFVEIGRLPAPRPSLPDAAAPRREAEEPSRSIPSFARATAAPSFGVEGGAIGFAATGGLGAAMDVTVAANIRWQAWSASVFGALPLTTLQVERDAGSAKGRLTLVGIRGAYSFGELWRIAPEVGVGVAVVDLSLQSQPALGFDGRDDRLITSLTTVEGALSLRIVDALRLRLRLGGGATAPRPVVRFEDHYIASWGRWVATGGLTLELDTSHIFASKSGRRDP
jgi:hypothetical protein